MRASYDIKVSGENLIKYKGIQTEGALRTSVEDWMQSLLVFTARINDINRRFYL